MRTLVIGVNFNNSHEIASFLEELSRWHPREETLIVDDGSTDGSDRQAEAKGFRVVRHGRNRGVGAALRTGLGLALSEGRWDAVAVVSCNGKMKPASLPGLIKALDDADYVQGNRYMSGANSEIPWDRRLGTGFFSFLGSALMARRFTDLTCGYRAYRLDLFRGDRAIDIEAPWLDRYEMEYFIHYQACRRGWRVVEVPVTIVYTHLPRARFTKIRPFVGWWSMFRPLLRLAANDVWNAFAKKGTR